MSLPQERMNALLQIMESLSAHFTTTLSKDFSGLSNGPTAVDDIAAEVCNTLLPLLPTINQGCLFCPGFRRPHVSQ